MRKLLFLAILVVFIGSMSACKKDSKTDILTGSSWKITAMTVNPGIEDPLTQTTITDFYNSIYYPSCAKDNFMTFNEDGTSVSDEGSTKCTATDPQTSTGTWAFNSDETQITFEAGTDDEIVYNISEMSDDMIKVSYSEFDTDLGETYTFSITMEPK